MSAKKPTGSKFGAYLGWILFLVTLPVLFVMATKSNKAEGILARDGCIANLRQIDDAKEDWALAGKKRNGETPDAGDLKPLLGKSLDDLKCPAGGKYTVHSIGTNPVCSVAEHKL